MILLEKHGDKFLFIKLVSVDTVKTILGHGATGCRAGWVALAGCGLRLPASRLPSICSRAGVLAGTRTTTSGEGWPCALLWWTLRIQSLCPMSPLHSCRMAWLGSWTNVKHGKVSKTFSENLTKKESCPDKTLKSVSKSTSLILQRNITIQNFSLLGREKEGSTPKLFIILSYLLLGLRHIFLELQIRTRLSSF